MADPFLGEIRAFGFNWPPDGWALCDGTLLGIKQYAALYSLIGKTFGGDGINTFALPDLRGRTPMHPDPQQGFMQGGNAGAEQVTLTLAQIPTHTHSVTAAKDAADRSATNVVKCYFGATVGGSEYYPQNGATLTPLDGSTITNSGGNAPHNNMQPSLVINYCIATMGLYPTHS